MSDFMAPLSLLVPEPALSRAVARRNDGAATFDQFRARVIAWRDLLIDTPGQSFALFIKDGFEFAGALFGAWQAEKTIYLPGDTLPATCAALAPTVDGFLGAFATEWSPLMPPHDVAPAGARHFHCLEPEFVGLVLYTSGTSGTAQPIAKKLAQLSREVATLEQQFGDLVREAEIVTTVSHQHIYGLLFQILWPLTAGYPFHSRTFDFLEELAPVLDERDCVLVSSPAHLKRLPENTALTATAKRLRAVFSSGAALPFDVAQQAQRLLRHAPIEVYGSSETGGVAWRQQHRSADAKWRPFPGVAWRIDPDVGVLEIRSPNLPDDDWFRTADRALAVDDDGFLLQGRVDRVAKIEGKRVSLNALESRLQNSPLVADARVAVLEGRRERIAAFIVLSRAGRQKLTEFGKLRVNRILRASLGESFEAVAIPRAWRYLDRFPLNGQGKTTRSELLASLELRPPHRTRPLHRLLERDARRAVFELIAPRNLIYFTGHFPGNPILPGVVQVDWVMHYGRQCFELPANFRALQALKFHRVIPPELPLTLELVYEPAKLSLGFKIGSSRGAHASGRILFGVADV